MNNRPNEIAEQSPIHQPEQPHHGLTNLAKGALALSSAVLPTLLGHAVSAEAEIAPAPYTASGIYPHSPSSPTAGKEIVQDRVSLERQRTNHSPEQKKEGTSHSVTLETVIAKPGDCYFILGHGNDELIKEIERIDKYAPKSIPDGAPIVVPVGSGSVTIKYIEAKPGFTYRKVSHITGESVEDIVATNPWPDRDIPIGARIKVVLTDPTEAKSHPTHHPQARKTEERITKSDDEEAVVFLKTLKSDLGNQAKSEQPREIYAHDQIEVATTRREAVRAGEIVRGEERKASSDEALVAKTIHVPETASPQLSNDRSSLTGLERIAQEEAAKAAGLRSETTVAQAEERTAERTTVIADHSDSPVVQLPAVSIDPETVHAIAAILAKNHAATSPVVRQILQKAVVSSAGTVPTIPPGAEQVIARKAVETAESPKPETQADPVGPTSGQSIEADPSNTEAQIRNSIVTSALDFYGKYGGGGEPAVLYKFTGVYGYEESCADTVSYIYYKAGLPFSGGDTYGGSRSNADLARVAENPESPDAVTLRGWFEQHGHFWYNTPGGKRPGLGDVVFFGDAEDLYHVGTIVAINGDQITYVAGDDGNNLTVNKDTANIDSFGAFGSLFPGSSAIGQPPKEHIAPIPESFVGYKEGMWHSGEKAPYTVYSYAVNTLKATAALSGLPESTIVTPQNILAVVAWEYGEGGNITNSYVFNVLNTGYYKPAWIVGVPNDSGLQSYKSFDAGVTAAAEAINKPWQNRIVLALSENKSAAQVLMAIASPQDYPGNLGWATSPTYLSDLMGALSYTEANFAQVAGTVIGPGQEGQNHIPVSELHLDTGTVPIASVHRLQPNRGNSTPGSPAPGKPFIDKDPIKLGF